VIEGSYDSKCDVWSAGVILYIMLSGKVPFAGQTESEIFKKISRGVFSFSGSQWSNISKEAKEFITRLLSKNIEKRPSAEEAWNDDWIQQRSKGMIEDNLVDEKALKKLAVFRSTSRLQQATLQYIASNLTASQQIEELRKAFVKIDKNGDGHLSPLELKLGYQNITLSSAIGLADILKNCDSDLNGMIDYNEFITATINWQKQLSQQILESAFKAYDRDKNGTISVNEIKMFLGADDGELDQVWMKILSDADTNGDGVIDLEEFKNIMLSEINA
jgi:calcium-dependent protein kinase